MSSYGIGGTNFASYLISLWCIDVPSEILRRQWLSLFAFSALPTRRITNFTSQLLSLDKIITVIKVSPIFDKSPNRLQNINTNFSIRDLLEICDLVRGVY